MASKYMVVQYVPDPIADERINFGVIAWDEGQVHARFLERWRRVSLFAGGKDITFLRDFATAVADAVAEQLLLPGTPSAVCIDDELLRELAGSWINSIQFTPPRSSLKDPESLVDILARRYLKEPLPKHRRARDRRAAGALAVTKIHEALAERDQELPKEYLRRGDSILGALDFHRFDAVVKNGKPYFAAHGLSFEGADSRMIEKEVSVTAWAVDDVRKRFRNLPVGIVVLPPKADNELYDRAKKVFRGLGADVLTEHRLGIWAREMAASLPIDS